MEILIICREDDASPKILANSLKFMLEKEGVCCVLNHNIGFLRRLLPVFGEARRKGSFHFVLLEKIKNWRFDRGFIKYLKSFDALVLSECTPNGFWKNHYGIENLKKIIPEIPIIYHEVYYLGNAPTQIKSLIDKGHPTIERYDWHLAVTEVTEIRSKPSPPWSTVGLNLEPTILKCEPRKDFFAIVDFEQKGYENYRKIQIEALEDLNIPYVSFEKRMPMERIRKYYKEAALIFLEFPEAFGVPIAECLASGTAIFTPSSSWAMSWRMDDNPEIHEEGELPSCFNVYGDKRDLKEKLLKFKTNYDLVCTPYKIYNNFLEHYPQFYHGNQKNTKDLLQRIKNKNFN